MDSWTTDPEDPPNRPMSPEEVKRRREAFDTEYQRRWRQQVESEDPPEYDPWTESYF